MIQFGSSLILINKSWSSLKSISSTRNLPLQYETDTDMGLYQVFCVDNTIVYVSQIFTGSVPLGEDQSQNDSDKSDFETNYKSVINAPLQPRATDGRINVLPNLFPTNCVMCLLGAADDPSNGIGKGTAFTHSSDDVTPTDHSLDFTFNDYIYLAGGNIIFTGGVTGDTINYLLYAPATATTAAAGNGNINFAGPGNVLIVPGSNTNNSVDLTKAVPVPNMAGTGFWDWVSPTNGIGNGTIVSNVSQTGGYDLYTISINLANLVVVYPILGSGSINVSVPAVVPKKVLPQWHHKIVVHNSGHTGLRVSWALVSARVKTT